MTSLRKLPFILHAAGRARAGLITSVGKTIFTLYWLPSQQNAKSLGLWPGLYGCSQEWLCLSVPLSNTFCPLDLLFQPHWFPNWLLSFSLCTLPLSSAFILIHSLLMFHMINTQISVCETISWLPVPFTAPRNCLMLSVLRCLSLWTPGGQELHHTHACSTRNAD